MNIQVGNKLRKRRYTIYADIDLNTIKSDNFFRAKTVNISYGGISMYTSEHVEVGKIVKVTIKSDSKNNYKGDDSNEPLLGEIKWVVKVGEKYSFGIQFAIEMNAVEFPNTLRYIKIPEHYAIYR